MRIPRASILLVLLATVSGCTRYRPVELTPAQADQRLRVQFAAPRVVTVTRTNGEAIRFDEVVEVTGRALSITADSVRLSVWSTRAKNNSPVDVSPGSTLTLARTDAARIEQWSVNERESTRTFLIVSGAVIVGLVVYIAIHCCPNT